ncbi:hypothetical protein TeGR_g9054 [Tetraparma gracilis]|uniref:Uncharacterized protein n=1 Tax=Tetraparma gracilis TaxID=2962635 RepID=A0ABQ6MLU4_9STRA|nr:hypothetical protein TeGR_g9054 [Tetraparma gracilis]
MPGMADREPCPWRIIEDVGGAFAMGAVGGSIYHGVRGAWTAPSGAGLRGATSAVKARAPVLGGNFAVWGLCFACCDCTFTAVRRKEDPWNAIASGFATGGILAARAGPKAAMSSAVIGGTLLALIEGLGIMITKYAAPALPSPEDYAASQAADPTAPPTQAGLGGGGGGLGLPPRGGGGEAARPDPLSLGSVRGESNDDFLAGGTTFSGGGEEESGGGGL